MAVIMNNSEQIETLIQEGLRGETLRDTLPNSAPPLKGEFEAMYFKSMREMMKTVVLHRVFDRKHDCEEGQDGAKLY